MRHLIAIALAVSGLAIAGCASKEQPKSALDACPHCEGVQTLTADGKCTQCGMTMSSADACSHCEGPQVATADGTCPKCGMKAPM